MSYVVPVKSKVEILQNFVAFSEYMNLTKSLSLGEDAQGVILPPFLEIWAKVKKILRLNHLLQEGRRRRVKLSLKMLIVWWDHTCHHAHLGLTGILLFSLFLYVLSAKTSESNLSDKQEGSNYVFQFIFCSFTIMDIPYMLKYLGMITILWHLVSGHIGMLT